MKIRDRKSVKYCKLVSSIGLLICNSKSAEKPKTLGRILFFIKEILIEVIHQDPSTVIVGIVSLKTL
jgi:hypothetical protein